MRLTPAIALAALCALATAGASPRSGSGTRPLLYLGLGHTEPVTALAWSPDGQMLATGSEDGSLRLWVAASGNERAAFYSLDGGKEWLVTTPAGYFATSARGAEAIQWRQGGKLWPVAKFRRRFERPDLVRQA